MGDRQLVYDVLRDGTNERYLHLWWLYTIWVSIIVLYLFGHQYVRSNPESKGAQNYRNFCAKNTRWKWAEKRPFLLAGLMMLGTFPLVSAALTYHSDSALLEQGHHLTYKWTLDADTFVEVVNTHPTRVQDRLNVGAIEFRIECTQNSRIQRKPGEPGTCLPVDLGDVLEVAYASTRSSEDVHALRIWRLPQDALTTQSSIPWESETRLLSLTLPR